MYLKIECVKSSFYKGFMHMEFLKKFRVDKQQKALTNKINR